ncbi:ATP-binding protein [Rhodopirellula bahusiensis]|uniref:histidine kinase n=1 Tax=Rhodopirellula bahusiensis TaxID=2014065 RepID=A0A2G1W791_9BACT|nr:ATP-binding protein [Rhodopirellula bahusiensis]PHQ34886.1 two-component sensor histidine kinase [Rhodopirellula bahusiensis]
MTRLFFRFYLGVILILFVAWLIQAYVFRGTTESANIKVIEDALSGGALSARDDLVRGGPRNYEATLDAVRARFAYPVNLVERSDRPMPERTTQRLDGGEAVLNGDKIDTAIPNTNLLIELGPLPQFVGPSQRDVLIGLGSVFMLVAGAIAILMRPIASQLRKVEHTALAIADGDLTARIDAGKRKRSLPIVGAFNAMADRVEGLLRSQKELLQAVSHELRTPLARIKFATELVRSADTESKREKRLDAIDEATDSLDGLVGELLDYTRHDEGCKHPSQEPVNVNDVVADVITVYAPLHPKITFETNDHRSAIEAITYKAGLTRAVGNLVSNAGKYAASRVCISVTRQDDFFSIAVDDDGGGIPENDRDIVFEPFRRLGRSQQPGSGLGLALVRRICRRLHGDTTVTSSELGGARFEIRLPQNHSSTTKPKFRDEIVT